MTTDFHTHAFPDEIADRAIATLQAETKDAVARLDGRLSSLLQSMDKAGIDRSVVCSIATKPAQFGKILDWSEKIRSERIIPFPSVHPSDPDAAGQVRKIAESGFKGLKLHPYYQSFEIDSEKVFPVYEEASKLGLIILSHTGFDIAFPRDRVVDPLRIARVLKQFPDLTFVASHFLAWEDWDEAERHLVGRPVYTDISFVIGFMGPEKTKKLFSKHPREYILFGTDSPWHDQGEYLAMLRELKMGDDFEDALLRENPKRLLDTENNAGQT